ARRDTNEEKTKMEDGRWNTEEGRIALCYPPSSILYLPSSVLVFLRVPFVSLRGQFSFSKRSSKRQMSAGKGDGADETVAIGETAVVVRSDVTVAVTVIGKVSALVVFVGLVIAG